MKKPEVPESEHFCEIPWCPAQTGKGECLEPVRNWLRRILWEVERGHLPGHIYGQAKDGNPIYCTASECPVCNQGEKPKDEKPKQVGKSCFTCGFWGLPCPNRDTCQDFSRWKPQQDSDMKWPTAEEFAKHQKPHGKPKPAIKNCSTCGISKGCSHVGQCRRYSHWEPKKNCSTCNSRYCTPLSTCRDHSHWEPKQDGLTSKEYNAKFILEHFEPQQKHCCEFFANNVKTETIGGRNGEWWVDGTPRAGHIYIDYCPFCGRRLP